MQRIYLFEQEYIEEIERNRKKKRHFGNNIDAPYRLLVTFFLFSTFPCTYIYICHILFYFFKFKKVRATTTRAERERERTRGKEYHHPHHQWTGHKLLVPPRKLSPFFFRPLPQRFLFLNPHFFFPAGIIVYIGLCVSKVNKNICAHRSSSRLVVQSKIKYPNFSCFEYRISSYSFELRERERGERTTQRRL